MSAALVSFDVGAAIAAAKARPLPAPEAVAAARRRNKLAAYRYLEAAARQGLHVDDPATEALLGAFRRDLARDAGLDERLVRRLG